MTKTLITNIRGPQGDDGAPAIPGLHAQNVTGAVTVAVEHEHAYELNATAAATVTLTGVPGCQAAVVWSGSAGTLEGTAMTAGSTAVAVKLTAGWKIYVVGATVAPSAPAAPTLNAPTVTSSSATVTWSAVSGATGYKARVNGGTATDLGNVLTYTASSLPASTAGTVEVQAYNAAGSSSWSSKSFTTSAPVGTGIRFNYTTNNNAGWANLASTVLAAYGTETDNGDGTYTYVEAKAPVVTGDAGNTDFTKTHLLWSLLSATGDCSVTFPFSAGADGNAQAQAAGLTVTKGSTNATNQVMQVMRNADGKYHVNAAGNAGDLGPGFNSGGIVVNTVTYGTSDIVRITRTGTVAKAEVSQDAGATWTTIATANGAQTTPVWAQVNGYAYTLTKPTRTGTWA